MPCSFWNNNSFPRLITFLHECEYVMHTASSFVKSKSQNAQVEKRLRQVERMQVGVLSCSTRKRKETMTHWLGRISNSQTLRKGSMRDSSGKGSIKLCECKELTSKNIYIYSKMYFVAKHVRSLDYMLCMTLGTRDQFLSITNIVVFACPLAGKILWVLNGFKCICFQGVWISISEQAAIQHWKQKIAQNRQECEAASPSVVASTVVWDPSKPFVLTMATSSQSGP